MTDSILGYDVDGRELRAGDRVEIVRAYHAHFVGRQGTALCCCDIFPGQLETTITDNGRVAVGFPSSFRIINSGRELFDQCAREADKMPTESTIRQRMPEKEES